MMVSSGCHKSLPGKMQPIQMGVGRLSATGPLGSAVLMYSRSLTSPGGMPHTQGGKGRLIASGSLGNLMVRRQSSGNVL